MKTVENILKQILVEKSSRVEKMELFQKIIWNSGPGDFNNAEEEEVYRALAYDFDFCYDINEEPDNEKIVREVEAVLKELSKIK